MRNLWTGVVLGLCPLSIQAQPAPEKPPEKPATPFPSMGPGVGFTPPKSATPTPTQLVNPAPKPDDAKVEPVKDSNVAGHPIGHWAKELKSADPTEREIAVRYLRSFPGGDIRKAGGVRLLMPLLDDADPGVRVNAIITTSLLGYETPEDARLVAAKLANSIEYTTPGSVIRVHAANALAGVGSEAEKAIPALVAASGDPAWETRHAIAKALGHAGAVTFKDVRVSNDGLVTTTAQQVERKPNDLAMRTLAFKLLRDPSGAVRAGAGQALVMIGPPRGGPAEYAQKAKPFIEAVATRLGVEREPAAKVWLQLLVVMYDGNQFLPQLQSITAQVGAGDEVTKTQSLLAIAMLGEKANSSRLAVTKALFDPAPGVAVAAITALLNMGDEAKLSLVELDKLGTVAKDEAVKNAAINAAAVVRKLKSGVPVEPAATETPAKK